MIITRTPFRVSFAGGGSDLPAFYEKHEGCVLSTSINKYMYITIHPSFDRFNTTMKYSKTECVSDNRMLQHPIAKQVLLDYDVSGIEVTSVADIPAGTGLGSSSAFTVGLIHAVSAFAGKYYSQEKLADKACEIEIDKLGEPIGKQDQYGCAVGGLKFIRFLSNGQVEVEPILLKKALMEELNDNLLMFYTGGLHSAGQILQEQQNNISQNDKFNNVVRMTELTYQLKESLQSGNIDRFGNVLNEGWQLKKELAKGISSEVVERYYNIALDNGALGGKLLGAGGCGFLLFYCPKENQKRLRSKLNELQELLFSFDAGGTKVVYVGSGNE